MPMPDPLENVMTMLRDKQGVDPNSTSNRSARLKQHRTAMGANPQATRRPPQGVSNQQRNVPPDVMPHTGGIPPEGVADNFQEQPNMMGVVIDGLNEAIIGLKTEIHRTQNPEQRRELERQAQGIRKQIVEMGGDPIYADETIEEGMKKLRGLGRVGTATLTQAQNDRLVGQAQQMGNVPLSAFLGGGTTQPQPTGTTTTTTKKQVAATGGGTNTLQQQAQAQGAVSPQPVWDDLFGTKGIQVNTPKVVAPQVPVPKIPDPMTADSGPDYFGGAIRAKQEGAVDELEELINKVTGREVSPRPVPQVDSEYVNQLIAQYGLEPKTEEEIAEAANVVINRLRWDQEKVINRELERFEREHPHEFEKAQKQIESAAARASADKQEEMAARGMFYSSIMGNALTSIDEKSLELIGEIARDAANYVAELHTDLKDVAQWAILEEEVIKKQMEAEDRVHRQNLMMMHVEVSTWADQMALDGWYKENVLQIEQDQLSLQGIQLKMAYADQKGQNLATAFMADHPLVQNSLVGMGITPENFANMPLEQQAAMVRNVIGFNEVEQQMRMNELNMRAVVAEIALKNAQLSLQAQIATGQFAMQGMGMAMDMMMHRDKMSLAWAEYGLQERSLNARLAGSGSSAKTGLSNSDFLDALDAGHSGNTISSAYAQSLRAQMTPEQRAIYDKSFNLAGGTSSDLGGFGKAPTATTQQKGISLEKLFKPTAGEPVGVYGLSQGSGIYDPTSIYK